MPQRLRQDQLLVQYGDPQSPRTKAQIRPIRLSKSDCLADFIVTSAHVSIGPKFVDAYYQTCRVTGEWPTEVQGYNVRKIAGSTKWSLHAWALAWDVFLKGSPRIDPNTGKGIPSVAWFNGMQSRGFFAGQNFKTPDLHHVEWPWERLALPS
jgi:hypothetical protein